MAHFLKELSVNSPPSSPSQAKFLKVKIGMTIGLEYAEIGYTIV